MSHEMEVLLKRRTIAELQSQQYALAIQEAQAKEDLRVLLSKQASTLSKGTGPDKSNENAIQNDENVAASSQDLPDLSKRVHKETTGVSSVPEVRHTAEHMASCPSLQYVTALEKRSEASTTQSPPVQSIETATADGEDVRHTSDRVESEGSVYGDERHRPRASQSPALQHSQTQPKSDSHAQPEHVCTQRISANTREYVPSQSFFLPARTSPTPDEPREEIYYMGLCNDPPTTTTSLVNGSMLLQSNMPSGGYFQTPARPFTSLASMPMPTNTCAAPLASVDLPQNTEYWHGPRHGTVSHGSTEHYQPHMVFQPNLWSTAPQNQFQFGPPSGNPYLDQAEASRYSLIETNPMQTSARPSPERYEAVTTNTLGSATQSDLSGLGSCALKKKTAPSAQQRLSLPQILNQDQQVSENLQHPRGSNSSNSRKRSSSITITNARSVKRRPEEPARVITPPLNQEGRSEIDRGKSRQEATARQDHEHNARSQSPTRSRSRSQSSHFSRESDETEEESDNYETPSDQSAMSSPRNGQGREIVTSMQHRIFPRVTSQPYTLHMQSRPRSPSAPPVRARQSVTLNQGHQSATIGRPPNQQLLRHRRAAGTAMLTNSYQPSPFRRLTPQERNELELRYCGLLARLLCDNTCVSSPPLPLCDETLWQRLRRRFPVEDGQEAPAKYKRDECYTNAADFEVDVKAMLRQYVVLGHCGEQAQNQGQSRNVRSARCEFEKTGNARVMCWRMRLESILDEKLRQLRYVLRECEDSYEGDDMKGKLDHVDAVFDGVRLGD